MSLVSMLASGLDAGLRGSVGLPPAIYLTGDGLATNPRFSRVRGAGGFLLFGGPPPTLKALRAAVLGDTRGCAVDGRNTTSNR
jgi:hypothetical protein